MMRISLVNLKSKFKNGFKKLMKKNKLIMEEKEKGGSNIVVIWC